MAMRENWSGRFGFIMAAAGSAIGLGNIWRFPYIAGEHGGGAFLLIYLGVVLLFGIPLLMAEIMVGRAAQRNPATAFRLLGGRRWGLVGLLGILTGFIILSFYIIVAGWTLAYVGFTVRGLLDSSDPAVLAGQFDTFTRHPWSPLVYAGVFLIVVLATLASGVRAGIERANKVLMPLLFILLVLLTIYVLRLPGAMEGVRFFLTPDFSAVTTATFSAALAQAFFSLSLGMGCMLTYGSYLSRDENLPFTAASITGLDIASSLLCGLLILPVVFAFGFDPASGPGLTFVTLPAAFANMPMGTVVGCAFFVLLLIAALTSAISILEPAVSYFVEVHGWTRPRTVAVCGAVCFALSVPASLSFGLLSGHRLFGMDYFTLVDFTATNILMPLGALLTAIFVGWVWARQARLALANDGRLHQPWAPVWLLSMRFVAPPAITWILLSGLGLL